MQQIRVPISNLENVMADLMAGQWQAVYSQSEKQEVAG
jgi:hypothetical protein